MVIALGGLLACGILAFWVFERRPVSRDGASKSEAAAGREEQMRSSSSRDRDPFRPQRALTARKKALSAEKQRFYISHGIDWEMKLGNVPGGARFPLTRFWIDRLLSEDPSKRFEAIQVLESAGAGEKDESLADEDSRPLKQDARLISKMMINELLTVIAYEGQYGSKLPHPPSPEDKELFQLPNSYVADPDTPILVEAFRKRLSDPATSERALRTLNAFTYDVYAVKDAQWWQTSYPQSRLAKIYAGQDPWTMVDHQGD